MNRVRRIASEIYEKNKTLFSTDFEKNKVALSQIAIVRSRQLRNQIAGYITSLVKGEMTVSEEAKPVELLANV